MCTPSLAWCSAWLLPGIMPGWLAAPLAHLPSTPRLLMSINRELQVQHSGRSATQAALMDGLRAINVAIQQVRHAACVAVRLPASVCSFSVL